MEFDVEDDGKQEPEEGEQGEEEGEDHEDDEADDAEGAGDGVCEFGKGHGERIKDKG